MKTSQRNSDIMSGASIRSEWLKVNSVRSLRILPLVAVTLCPALAVVVGTTESLQPNETVLGGAMTGSALGLALIGVWGALLVTSEFSSGTIRAVLAATPHRGTVLVAKAVVAAGVAGVVGLIASGSAIPITTALLDTTKYRSGQFFPALFGVAACYPAMAVLGVAIGVLLRSSAGAVGAMLLVSVLPGLLAPLLGGAGRWVAGVGPTAVVAKLAQSSEATPETVGSLGGWASLVMLVGYSLVALLVAGKRFENRDV